MGSSSIEQDMLDLKKSLQDALNKGTSTVCSAFSCFFLPSRGEWCVWHLSAQTTNGDNGVFFICSRGVSVTAANGYCKKTNWFPVQTGRS